MPIYDDIKMMLDDSLHEHLVAAKWCLEFDKEKKDWHKPESGCLGFPTAVLLFTITDTIGSVFEGIATMKIPFPDGDLTINGSGHQHFYILNSKYYGKDLKLSENTIVQIYDRYRNLLVHNASIAGGHFLDIGNEKDKPFLLANDIFGNEYPCKINLYPLYLLCETAVSLFCRDLYNNALNLSNSKLIKNIKLKARRIVTLPYTSQATTGFTESTTFRRVTGYNEDED